MNTFSISEALRFGWTTFKKRPWFFIGVCIGLTLVSVIINGAVGKLDNSFLTIVVSLALNAFFTIAYVKLVLGGFSSPEALTIEGLWEPKHFLNMLGAVVLMTIIIFVGFILLIIPGIIASLALLFTTLLVVDRSLGPIAALKESYRLTKGHWWHLFLFTLAMAGINLVGLLLLFVGILVSLPVSMLATVFVYKKLSAQSSPVPQPSMAASA